MKHFRKSIGLILAVLMLVSMTSVFATNPDRYDYDCYGGYNTYMCIGDSIAAGYTVSGIYMDPICLGFNRVTGAYHDLVATGINAELLQLGCSAFRTVELRYILDGVYTDKDGIWNEAFAQAFTIENLNALKPYFISAVQASDIITVNLGSNDVLSYSYIRALLAMYKDTSSDAMKAVKACIEENGGDVGQAFLSMLSTAQMVGKLPSVLFEFTKAFNEAFAQYKENWNASLKAIYEMNPNVQIITVGVYNPANNISITEGGNFKVGPFMQPFVDQLNSFLKSGQDYAGKAPYANVDGTETWPISVTGGDFTAKYNWCSHPTRAGHMYMAAKIMEVIPNRYADETPAPSGDTQPSGGDTQPSGGDTQPSGGDTQPSGGDTQPSGGTQPADNPAPSDAFPFDDVAETDWFYEAVKYCFDNGLMDGKTDTKFEPKSSTTRAEFATVLYRMSDSPAVTSENPFSDCQEHWAKDAITWAYENKIVDGMTEKTFAPNDNVTREQMVAMLYRYMKNPAVTGDLSAYKDGAAVSGYAVDAFIWATQTGLVTGRTADTLVPKGQASRAELATILQRLDQLKKA